MIALGEDGSSFDVTLGTYYGVEVCDLIGIHMLYSIEKRYNSKDFCLYSDNGLTLPKNVNGPALAYIEMVG